MLVARSGATWVGLGKSGAGFGLGQLQEGKWKVFSVPGLDGDALNVSALLEDRLGALWVGTADQGIYRIWNDHFEHFGADSGLSGNTVSAEGLIQDQEGTIWVATSNGIDTFRELPVTVYSTRQGLEADGVEAVLPTRGGPVWISNLTLETIVANAIKPAPVPLPFEHKAVTSMLERSDGTTLIGFEDSLYAIEKGTFIPILDSGGAPLGIPETMFEDSAGDVWLNTVGQHKIFRIGSLGQVEDLSTLIGDPSVMTADRLNGIWAAYDDGSIARFDRGSHTKFPVARKDLVIRPTGILPLADGALLVSTLRGLDWRRGATQLRLDTNAGLPCNTLYGLIEDAKGVVWINAICGLIRIEADELRRWAASPSSSIAYRRLTTVDGFQPGRGAFAPSFSRGPDGRIWLANGKVAEVFDPEALSDRTAAPAVLIESLTADRIVHDPATALSLPTNPKDISIRFTALTYVVPQRVRFQYRLDGRDSEWRDGGTERQAYFTDLPPGSYRFRVRAGTSDGGWGGREVSTTFEIPPAYYQTRWFQALIALVVLALLYGAYAWRLRQVSSRISDRILAKNKERERIARDLHDTLLQGTQGLAYSVLAAVNQIAPDHPVKAMLERAVERADEVIVEGREAIQGLRISGDVDRDLFKALCLVGTQLADNYGIGFDATQEGELKPLMPTVRDELYQIGREAMLNAFKHAQATAIELHIACNDDGMALRILDNGIGLSLEGRSSPDRPGHWGLQGMRERAERVGASLDIWSRPAAGTEVAISVKAPLAYLSTSGRWKRFWLSRQVHPQ